MKAIKRWVYLVYCNDKPIVYAVYSNKKKAVNYALQLIELRKKDAAARNDTFSLLHWLTEQKNEIEYNCREKLIFSTCLGIKDKEGKPAYDDNCFIQVIRRNISV